MSGHHSEHSRFAEDSRQRRREAAARREGFAQGVAAARAAVEAESQRHIEKNIAMGFRPILEDSCYTCRAFKDALAALDSTDRP